MAKKISVVVGSVVTVVLIFVITLISMSLKKLDSFEVAVRYNNILKTLQEDPYYEGLHFGPPGFSFIRFPSVFKTMNYYSKPCLNEDGVTIKIDISFQYRVRSAKLKYIVENFKDEEGYIKVLRYTGSSAIQESCSKFNTSQFQAERGRFQEELTSSLVDKFETLDCDVTDLQVNNIARPVAYENAIKYKETARQDIEVARNERPQRLTKAETVKLQAETEAEIILNEAESEARITLTRAAADAQAVLDQYQREADSYKAVMDANNLDSEGFLAYMGIRAIASSKNPVNIAMKAPAKTSYSA